MSKTKKYGVVSKGWIGSGKTARFVRAGQILELGMQEVEAMLRDAPQNFVLLEGDDIEWNEKIASNYLPGSQHFGEIVRQSERGERGLPIDPQPVKPRPVAKKKASKKKSRK